jgi:hypothetical protein
MILNDPNEVQGAEFGRVTRAYWLVPLRIIARDVNPRLVIVVIAKVSRTARLAITVNRSRVDFIFISPDSKGWFVYTLDST